MEVPARALPRSAAEIPVEVYAQPGPQQAYVPGQDGAMTTEVIKGPAPPHKLCVVCQQAIAYHSAMKTFVCTHVCHADCADRWLRTELHCPLCKNQVLFPMAEVAYAYARVGGTPAKTQASLEEPHLYGTCRDCHAVFYRDPAVVKPETNAYYRCPNCRSFDVVNMLRASCTLQ